jgi:hypothetical protein
LLGAGIARLSKPPSWRALPISAIVVSLGPYLLRGPR